MFTGILALLGAIVLSIVSAIFSIQGIQTIFSGAIVWATIMAAAMEFAKIGSTIWIYQFWKKTKVMIKSYLMAAIMILILISSIGIYGFLAKAYVGQIEDTINVENRIARLETSIQQEERSIARANENIQLLDDAIQSYIDLNAISKGLDRRDEQKEERDNLYRSITNAENNIAEYEDRILELQTEKEVLAVDVGPIKYIAILLYGENKAEINYDNAARIFIILLVFVFDPLAVLLMVAGNIAIGNWNEEKKKEERKSTTDDKKKLEDMLHSAKLEGIKEEKEKHIPTSKVSESKPKRVVKREEHPILTRKEEMNEKRNLNSYDPISDDNPFL